MNDEPTVVTITLSVEGMRCQHCARAIQQAIQAEDPTATIEVDLSVAQVRVSTQLPPERLARAIAGEGYRLAVPRAG